MAVIEVTSEALAHHIPEYQKLTTVIAVGEDLIKPARQISRRAADIQLALQQQLLGLGLAAAIDEIIRNALKAEGLALTVGNVEKVLVQISSDENQTVVPFERPA